MRRSYRYLIISLVLVLAGGLLAWWTQTNGGTVSIRDVRFMGTNGTMMSGLLYVPDGVTNETPAPGILAIHGYINSRETQDGFAIEYARRGYVVLALDQTGHGYSDGPAFANGFGGPDGLAYLRTLDIVDKENIGLEGHSMGGWAVAIAAGVYPDDYQSIVLAGSSTGTFGAPEGTPEWPRNLGLIFSEWDEFSQLMWGAAIPKDIVTTDKLKTLFNTTETVEVGKLYGSVADGTARMLFQPRVTHPGDHISRAAIGDAMAWMQMTLDGGNGLDPAKQIWFWKEIGTLIALIGMVLFFVSMGAVLLRTRYFNELSEPMPVGKGATGIMWWVAALLTMAIPIFTFFWLQTKGNEWLPASALWPQNITTGIMVWALGNGLITLVLFLLWHFTGNRAKGANGVSYGCSWAGGMHWGRIGKSFLLAAIVAFGAYLLLAISGWLFTIDFRFWVVAVKEMSPLHFRIFLSYLLPFTLFFLILSTALHGQMRQDKADGSSVSLTRAIWTNVILLAGGFVIFLLVQYIPFVMGGTLFSETEPLLVIVAFQFVPLLSIVAIFSTYFYRKTGHIYVGAFMSAIFVTWMIAASQAIHFAF